MAETTAISISITMVTAFPNSSEYNRD